MLGIRQMKEHKKQKMMPRGMVPQGYLRSCLQGLSPNFTPIKLNSQISGCAFFMFTPIFRMSLDPTSSDTIHFSLALSIVMWNSLLSLYIHKAMYEGKVQPSSYLPSKAWPGSLLSMCLYENCFFSLNYPSLL